MKKVLIAAGIVSVMASSAFALQFNGTNVVGEGVVGSKHDMNQYTLTTKDSEGRVCAFCHTPHHSLSDNTGKGLADYLPLWSHKITEQTSANGYTSFTVGVGGNDSLRGATILCMSCHDGVVAVDEHYNNQLQSTFLDSDGFGGTAIGLKDGNGAGSFGNDHPIGFMYADALIAHPNDLEPATAAFKGTPANGRPAKTIEQQLTQGWFTCATCHDVHNKDNVANTYTGPGTRRNYFLLGDNNGSLFCLSCHIK